jgi:two-component system cell cycle sensor histidine kinase/response regulator CckA
VNILIRILLVDDSEDDAFLVTRELIQAGLQAFFHQVHTLEDFQEALNTQNWDIVISDYTMPRFSGIEALEMLRRKDEHIPFIFVSGTLSEDQAVAAMRLGANDYVLKGNLKRLPPAVERSIKDGKISRERKIYEKQFLQSQKMESLGKLTGGIAHDFNNLLMIIQGNLECLRDDLFDQKNYLQQVEQALDAVQTGATLIKRLMAFSKLQQLQPSLFNLQDVIPEVTKLLRPLLGAAIDIKLHIQEHLHPVCLDQGQFENALINLAINARDAMNGKGSLTIEASHFSVDEAALIKHYNIASGDYIKVAVTDTGCGIASENIERVCEPFFTTKELGKGTGLGLSMVYGFLKQSNAYINIYSELGHGTVINLYLPKAENISLPKYKPNSLVIKEWHGTETLLLIEDETSLRKLTANYLEKLGYHVLEAENGEVALEILMKEPNIQLLLTDVIMPKSLTGPELVEKALLYNPHLKIIFMSGYPKNVLLSENRIHNEDYPLLMKPFSRLELATLLRKVLDTEISSFL